MDANELREEYRRIPAGNSLLKIHYEHVAVLCEIRDILRELIENGSKHKDN
jgi:hypothetical protein